MKVKSVVAIILLSNTGLFSGCGILNKLMKNSSASTGAYSALFSKKEELANFQSIDTISGKETPKIEGKVAIVKKEAGGKTELDRFNWEGKFSDEPADETFRFYPRKFMPKPPKKLIL